MTINTTNKMNIQQFIKSKGVDAHTGDRLQKYWKEWFDKKGNTVAWSYKAILPGNVVDIQVDLLKDNIKWFAASEDGRVATALANATPEYGKSIHK